MIQPPDIRFNLYWNWKIRLKAKGVEYMKTERPDLALGDDGFLTIKGWEFIKLFGPSIKEGRSPYFENIIHLSPPPIYPDGEKVIIKIDFTR